MQFGAVGSVIRGLVLNGAAGGLTLNGGGSHTIVGNFVGTDASGTVATSGHIFLNGSSGNVIGGATPASRNVLVGNSTEGIYAISGSNNNRIIAVSGEFYVAKADCVHGVNLVKGTTSITQYETYKDAAGQWRFHLRATNGKLICASSESYWNEADCRASCQLLVNTNAATPLVDVTFATTR